jgi:hypothetical protein
MTRPQLINLVIGMSALLLISVDPPEAYTAALGPMRSAAG